MITDIKFFSLERMKEVVPSRKIAVVSILDKDEELNRPIFKGFGPVLILQFEDTFEEGKLASPGAWPDEPSEEEHTRFCQRKGERISTLSNARDIVNFLAQRQSEAETWTLIAHCAGGISRSAAVAHWASVKYWVPITGGLGHTDFANARLLRLMDKAANRL